MLEAGVKDRFGKFVLTGALAVIALIAGLQSPLASPGPVAHQLGRINALDLADLMIQKDPSLLIFDLRDTSADKEVTIPGAFAADNLQEIPVYLDAAPENSIIVLIAERSTTAQVPEVWPRNQQYLWLNGGSPGWQAEVLTPAKPIDNSEEEIARVNRQNQIAAYFSGAKVEVTTAPPPPPSRSGGKKMKKASGGC